MNNVTGLGYTLRVAREQQGLALDDVARATRLNKATLIALEAEAFHELPGSFYAKNAIRQYASFLDLPAERLVRLYPERHALPPMEAPGWLPRPGGGWAVWALVGGVVLVMVALLYGLVQAYRPRDEARQVGPVIVISPATPTPLPPATPEPTAASTPTRTATPSRATATAPAEAARATATVSPGPTAATTAVPSVVGISAADAEQRLRAAGFAVSRQEAFSSAAAGSVVEQNPPAGTQRRPGETVILVVSRGPPGITVPNVVGLPEAQALAVLQQAGLRVNPNVNRQGREQVLDRVLETVCVGCVLSTSPAAGTVADATTVVNVAVRRE